MTKFCLLALGLALGACDTIGPGNHPTVAGVQGGAVYRCGFSPLETVTDEIVKARPMQSDASLAAQICAAVKDSKRGSVAGVAIEGVFVRKVR